jgi:hypothetical protein
VSGINATVGNNVTAEIDARGGLGCFLESAGFNLTYQ